MPADDCVGLDDDQDLLPARPDPRQEDPEGSIDRSDPRLGSFLSESGELLAQGEFNDSLVIPISKEGRNAAEEEHDELEQRPHREEHLARNHCLVRD